MPAASGDLDKRRAQLSWRDCGPLVGSLPPGTHAEALAMHGDSGTDVLSLTDTSKIRTARTVSKLCHSGPDAWLPLQCRAGPHIAHGSG